LHYMQSLGRKSFDGYRLVERHAYC